MVALPQIQLGQHPSVVGVGHQVLRHHRQLFVHLPKRPLRHRYGCLEFPGQSRLRDYRRHSIPVSHRQQLWQIRLHPMTFELPISAVVHKVLEGVVHDLQLPLWHVMRSEARQRLVDDLLAGFGVQVLHPLPNFVVGQVRATI